MGETADQTPRSLSIFSLLAIIVTGLIPIWGVTNYGWDAIQIVVLFWLETLLVGIFTWLRVRDARGAPAAAEACRALLDGRVDARDGLMLSM